MNHTGERPVDPITFMIYPNDQGAATTTLYEDDGLSPAYREGVSRRTTVRIARASDGYQVKLDAPVGNYQTGARNFVFVVKCFKSADKFVYSIKYVEPSPSKCSF